VGINILVIGAGSIGTRHIQNLLTLGVDVSAYRYRTDHAKYLSAQFGIRVFTSLDDALESGQDAVVICNRPDQHIEVALAAAHRGIHLFIEKPLSCNMHGVRELKELVRSRSLVVEVGCMMRFHPNLLLIHKLLSEGVCGQPYFARSYVGQYLPDWRPNQDYRCSYSAKKDQGGGVLFDLVHELDYLVWWFGGVSQVTAFLDHLSELEIETEDVAQILLRFQKGVVAQVHMDYLRPFYLRTCEVVGKEGIISWDYSSGSVRLKLRGVSDPKVFSVSKDFERNQMFVDHIRHFLNRIREGGKPAVSLEDGIHVLEVALACHRSSEEGKVIRL
jgi:predicted dehydrogenase